MKIFIDADGCPVVDLAISIAKEYKLKILIVKNYAHVIEDDYAKVVSVDISRDSADFFIVNKVKESDIVVTQDYGLATICLAKNARVINENGLFYTKENIDGMLNRRHLHRELRKQGKYHSKSKKRQALSDVSFKNSLKELIEKQVKTIDNF